MSLFGYSRGIAIRDQQTMVNHRKTWGDNGKVSFYWVLGGNWEGLWLIFLLTTSSGPLIVAGSEGNPLSSCWGLRATVSDMCELSLHGFPTPLLIYISFVHFHNIYVSYWFCLSGELRLIQHIGQFLPLSFVYCLKSLLIWYWTSSPALLLWIFLSFLF